MSVLISAIIPVYNSQEFLEECIKSLRCQSLKNIEMIFINDGSSDKSLDMLKRHAKNDSRIKIIDQKNSGPSLARNKGLDIAQGEYISFIDSDDWIDKNMFEEMYKAAKDGNSDVVICDMKIISKDDESYVTGLHYPIKNLNKRVIKEIIFKELLSNSQFNSMANKIFRNYIIKENNIRLDKDIYYAEDWLFNIEFFKKATKVSYVNKAFYYYRRGHESSSSSYKDDTFEKVGLWIYRKRNEYARQLGVNEYAATDELYTVIIHCIVSEFRRKDISFKQKRNRVKNILSESETKEVVKYMNKDDIGIKDKYLLFCIKHKLSSFLHLYVIVGKIKERKLV